jgi:hypothetical protein
VQTLRRVPSHAPPQALPSVAQATRGATGGPVTALQVPASAPGTPLQASHCPSQAESQQTPSTQWPLTHWLEARQEAPSANCGTQLPLEHQLPAAHWPSPVQVVKHALTSQT